jgi:GNAT superfamily N-acetyltransferase
LDLNLAPAIPGLGSYAAVEVLRNKRRVDIRALRPYDRTEFAAAFQRISSITSYRRFFAVRRNFSEAEVAFFTNVDFKNHVALVALVDEGGSPTIVGAGRYVIGTPGCAEVAFTVIDDYQGQGIGSALLRHIIAVARSAGLTALVAEVLAENTQMIKAFQRWHPYVSIRHDGSVVHVALDLINAR